MPNRNVDAKQKAGKPRIVGADEFKQTLLKYFSRQIKGGKGFALLGFTVSNADTIANVAGQDSLDKLVRALRSTLSSHARSSDVLCPIAKTRILLLRTESDSDTAEPAPDLDAALSNLSISGHHVRPTVQIISVRSDDGSLDSLLERLGCTLDEHGDLGEIRPQAQLRLPGTKDNWLTRYELRKKLADGGHEARDSWRNQQCVITSIELQNCSAQIESNLIKRARTLQSIEHHAIQRLEDFWIEGCELLMVHDMVSGKPLTDWLARHKLNAAALMDFLLEFASILLYLQALTPPVVPAQLVQKIFIVGPDSRLLLTDFHNEYLMQDSDAVAAGSQTYLDTLVELLRAVRAAAEDGLPESTATLFEQLEAHKLPRELATLHKVRGALRDAAEGLGAPKISPLEPVQHA